MMLIASIAWCAIIRVPDDQPTIQAGIDAAADGDTVLVADGIYTGEGNKNLDFKGNAITVTSENGAEATIIDCEGSGRGFYFHFGETQESVVSGFTIRDGYVEDYGGGIYCENSSPTITNNIIAGNSAGDFGGGISCFASSPTITNNIIEGNSAQLLDGGGIDCFASSPTITNNIIAGNSAGDFGGAISCLASSPTITNNTIIENLAFTDGGGITCSNSSFPTLTNTILWDNSPNEIIYDLDEILVGVTSFITVTYSDIQGGWEGEGNIDADPLFIDPDNGDYHLSDYSPCIGAGIMIPDAPDADIEDNPRPNPSESEPDIGAYENNRRTPLPRGDVSGNENVTAFDASLVLQHVVGIINLSEGQPGFPQGADVGADVTGDKLVSALDAALILQYTVGLITQFPVQIRTAAPFLAAQPEEDALRKAISQLETSVLNRKQKQILEQLKNLVSPKSPPKHTALFQNFPNPFNPETWIPFQLAKASEVIIYIYNLAGQPVRTIQLGYKQPGVYIKKSKAAYWDGRNDMGEKLANGVYFYELRTETFQNIRKMILLK